MDIVSDSFMDSSSSLASLASLAKSLANSELAAAGSVAREGGGCSDGDGETSSQLLLALSPLVAALEAQCCWQQWGLQQQQQRDEAHLLLLEDKRWAAGWLEAWLLG